ncbi:hypothetical protein MKW92_046674 [Papaver armeniacum]|nr:hypothetical protein MKW92_046674 [Papaver armeniacum]
MAEEEFDEKTLIHTYDNDTFQLHRLPVPEPGEVIGLVGANGVGKLLAGTLTPNLGRYKNPPAWEEILKVFAESKLQKYFFYILDYQLQAVIKTQNLNEIPKLFVGNVGKLLDLHDERGVKAEICRDLELNQLLERNMSDLSGGELQRFAISVIAMRDADAYMFDEPSTYLDVKQRHEAARLIRSLCSPRRCMVVADHDLSVLGYLSDIICCLYGVPGTHGFVTDPYTVTDGINVYMDGSLPPKTTKPHPMSLDFKVAETPQTSAEMQSPAGFKYPTIRITRGKFKLRVMEGKFTDSQVVVMLGENGTGKTTFLRLLAGLLKRDEVESSNTGMPEFNVSYKAQILHAVFPSTVRALLYKKIHDSCTQPQFVSDVMEPLQIEQLMDKLVVKLSCGEIQRVALCLCLGKPADVYLIDEPSAYLDSEQRLATSKVIKRFIHHGKKTAFVVEHDITMATYLADRVIVCEGRQSVDCTANAPQSLLSGMSFFLSFLLIRANLVWRDSTNFRPWINKLESTQDREQKASGSYYYLGE